MDAGVDGIISNYPDRVRALMEARGLKLPKPYREPRKHDCIAGAEGAFAALDASRARRLRHQPAGRS